MRFAAHERDGIERLVRRCSPGFLLAPRTRRAPACFGTRLEMTPADHWLHWMAGGHALCLAGLMYMWDNAHRNISFLYI